MATHGYRRKDYRRACDCCGAEWWFSQLKYVGQSRWYCPDDAPGLTAEQISRHNARVKPLVVKTHKHARPPRQIPTYLSQEALNFAMVRDYGLTTGALSANNAGGQSGSQTRVSACGMYIGEVLAEGERPTSWLTAAAVSLRAFADATLANQYGSPTGPNPSEALTSARYGITLAPAGAATPQSASMSGIMLLRAYQLLGDTKYLDGANRLATSLRQGFQQRQAGVAILSPTSSYLGGFCNITDAANNFSSVFVLGGGAALWFLAKLRAVVGGSKVYGSTVAGGDFASAPAGTLDTMMAEARAFYAGNKISGFRSPTGTNFGPMSMLSTATPRDGYDSGSGAYQIFLQSSQYTIINVQNLAFCLRGLFEYEGYSATVASIYEWLMSFTTNPLSLPGASDTSFTIANGLTGTYDPNVALCTQLSYADSTGSPVALSFGSSPMLTTSIYDTTTAGILAPVRIASGRDLSVTKSAFQPARRIIASHTDTNNLFAYPSLRGTCGLSFQMPTSIVSTGFQTWAFTNNAALCGLVYRYAPKATPNVRTP